MKHTLSKLAYEYNALEPHLDARTMEIHHSKHHQGYVNKLNANLEKHPGFFEKSLEDLLKDPSQLPTDIRQGVINTGGGHYNHSLFWEIMSPDGGGEPTGELAEAINAKFSSFENFKEEFSNAAATLFGSGWAWLSVDSNKELVLEKTSNQDCPLSKERNPIMCIDVWEHAYYLNYQNKRPEFIEKWWNLVNWEAIAVKYKSLIS